ncbi:hypothetical protein N7484_006075 [Penicillium longicatenatum]|nr:hypothetical protein N7484_006075 [Penicillium longicatenatum]
MRRQLQLRVQQPRFRPQQAGSSVKLVVS